MFSIPPKSIERAMERQQIIERRFLAYSPLQRAQYVATFREPAAKLNNLLSQRIKMMDIPEEGKKYAFDKYKVEFMNHLSRKFQNVKSIQEANSIFNREIAGFMRMKPPAKKLPSGVQPPLPEGQRAV